MRAWCVAATALLGALVVAILAGTALLLRGGIGARRAPSAVEAAIARRVRSVAIPARAKDVKNPLPPAPAVVAQGRAHFADHCASCHANDGSGDTELGRRLYPRAPDLRQAATQGLSDGELFWIIENGVKLTGMPGWGGEGDEDESWALVAFIRHLPRLAPEEKADMERLNPKSPAEWREQQEDDAFLGDGAPPEHAHH